MQLHRAVRLSPTLAIHNEHLGTSSREDLRVWFGQAVGSFLRLARLAPTSTGVAGFHRFVKQMNAQSQLRWMGCWDPSLWGIEIGQLEFGYFFLFY